MPELIEFTDVTKIQLCVGSIIEAKLNKKAKMPAYVLTKHVADVKSEVLVLVQLLVKNTAQFYYFTTTSKASRKWVSYCLNLAKLDQ